METLPPLDDADGMEPAFVLDQELEFIGITQADLDAPMPPPPVESDFD